MKTKIEINVTLFKNCKITRTEYKEVTEQIKTICLMFKSLRNTKLKLEITKFEWM